MELGTIPLAFDPVFFVRKFLSKTTIQIQRNIILLVALYGCKIWSLTLREEQRLRI